MSGRTHFDRSTTLWTTVMYSKMYQILIIIWPHTHTHTYSKFAISRNVHKSISSMLFESFHLQLCVLPCWLRFIAIIKRYRFNVSLDFTFFIKSLYAFATVHISENRLCLLINLSLISEQSMWDSLKLLSTP